MKRGSSDPASDLGLAVLRRAERALAVRSSGLLLALLGVVAIVWVIGAVPTALLIGVLALLVVD